MKLSRRKGVKAALQIIAGDLLGETISKFVGRGLTKTTRGMPFCLVATASK